MIGNIKFKHLFYHFLTKMYNIIYYNQNIIKIEIKNIFIMLLL